jgi:predicted DNA binding CopG/RHH family protein
MDVPEFRTEAEEAAWWDRNANKISAMIMQRGVKGKLVKVRERTQLVSIRVPVSDLELAKELAARSDQHYQTILKRALRTGLGEIKQEERRSARSARTAVTKAKPC